MVENPSEVQRAYNRNRKAKWRANLNQQQLQEEAKSRLQRKQQKARARKLAWKDRKKAKAIEASAEAARLETEAAHMKTMNDMDTLQNELFNCSLRFKLEARLKGSKAALVNRIYQGTPSSCIGPNKNYSLVNIEQLEDHLQHPEHPGLLLVIDQKWFKNRHQLTLKQFKQQMAAERIKTKVDIQTLHIKASQTITANESISVFHNHLKNPYRSNPMNLLNLTCKTQGLSPPPLSKHCTLLTDACQATRGEAITSFRGKSIDEMPVDIEDCQQFMLCGQAGFVTSWHMDDKGVMTWVTLEGNDNELDDYKVLKPWPVVDLWSLPEAERERAKEDFGRLGENWQPDPKWIRVFTLIRGQTLIMPPGTIHAPITLTNCLLRGGMCWDRRFFVSHSLGAWDFIAKNRDTVTNEEPSKQTQKILDFIFEDIKRHPKDYRVNGTHLQDIRRVCDRIIKYSKPCQCHTSERVGSLETLGAGIGPEGCSIDCSCLQLQLQCHSGCPCGGDCRRLLAVVE